MFVNLIEFHSPNVSKSEYVDIDKTAKLRHIDYKLRFDSRSSVCDWSKCDLFANQLIHSRISCKIMEL